MEFRLSKDDVVAEETTKYITSILTTQARKSNKKLLLGLSGGNSPIILYENLSNAISPELAQRIILIQIDERVVETTHEDSNQNLINRTLKKLINNGAQFFPIGMDETHSLAMAHTYDAQVQNVFSQVGFSLAIMGVGNDGHTASIFPNEQSIAKTDDYVFVSATEHMGYVRVSLSYRALFSFTQSIMYAPGESKLAVVNLIKDIKHKNKYPAAYFMHNCKNAVLITSNQ